MNFFLNDLGAAASRAGSSMLWQTTALVLLLLLVEISIGRRLRPALRCALWLLVVVKLWLPPSLQLPTGAGYWLGPWLAAPRYVSPPARMTIASPVIEPETDPLAVPSPVLEPTPLPMVRTPLDFFGGLALVWFAGSVALGGWLIRCNREVHRLVGDAEPAPPEYQKRLEEAAARIGLRRRPELRLTRANHSPAVCGLFRPVILLPVALTQRLTATALSDVLLHELVHVQRRDLWFHLPQALAQVVWWWNPCVWLANARIRALREQAVDEGVMRVRSGDPATYPATLVEVARHCASRPAVMLSLVGILESRRALRVRVERLLNSGVPRRAGLGWSGWLVVLVAALVTLPMAFARRVEVQPSPSFLMNPALAQRYGPTGRPSPASEADTASRPNSYQMDPLIRTPHIPYIGAERQRIQSKLDRIILNEVQFDGLPLSEVVNYLDEQVRAKDPEGRGLNFIINSTMDVISPSAVPQIDPNRGTPIQVEPVDLNRVLIRLVPGLRDVRLADAIDAIAKVAERPLKYSIEDYGIVFTQRSPENPQLHNRSFRVDPNTFLQGLEAVVGFPFGNLQVGSGGGGGLGGGQQGAGITVVTRTNLMANFQIMVRQFFSACGVDFPATALPGQQGARFTPPALGLDGLADPMANQKALFFNDRTGILFVRATLSDLDVIEQAIAALNVAPARSIEKTTRNLNLVTAQVMIKVLFAEVETEAEKALGLDWFVSRPANPTNASLEVTGILTEPQLRTVIKAFEQRGGATLTAAPGFTTGNGNQIRVNMIENTVSLVDPVSRRTNGLSVDRNLHMQLRVSADLRSVYLTTGVHMNQVVVGDGQTVVLTGEDPAGASGQDQKAGPGAPAVKRKRLWVFITPTLLDSAGQRVNPPNTTRP